MTTRSRGSMPPPAPLPAGWRQAGEHDQGAQQPEPTWPPVPGAAPAHRPAAPDPRYAAPPPPVDNGQYRYPDQQQRGYEQAAPAARPTGPSLSELAASMRTADAAHHYQDAPQQPRYGHQGHAAYAAPPPAPGRAHRAAPVAAPPPPPRADDLRGAQYDDWQQPPPDPASYDLGSYGRPAARGQPVPDHRVPPPDTRQPGWQNGHLENPDFEPYPSRHDERGPPRHAQDRPHDSREQDYADEEEEDEEPRRGGRRWLIIAALVGSIGLGGGLAYVYKAYVVDKTNGKPPVVKASQQPSRTAPENPGGKQFANQDSKMLGKLEQDAGRGDLDATGVRRVPTVQINRDGTLGSAPAPVLPPTNRPSVPGITFVDGFSNSGGGAPVPPAIAPRAAPELPAARAEVTPPRANIPPPPPPPPAVKNAAPPPPAPRAEARVAAGPPPAAEAPAATKRAPARTTEVAAAPPAAVPKATGNGFVAVLTTRRSRMDALSQFADLQQRYPILQGKVPDVIEADLTSRNLGTMYRLVVGPPGTRGQVAALCSQLKSAGYTDCWATSY